jgi:hypothetical protein
MHFIVIGAGFVAIAVGFMVGNSASPVAGAAIPAIVGLVVTAVGFVNRGAVSKDLAELLAKAASDAQIRRVLAMDELRRDASKRTVGITLILFTVCYLAGVYGGAAARVHGLPGLTIPTVPAELFPWTEHTRPATPERALEWVEVAAKLRALGHNDTQIIELYNIDVARNNALLSQYRTPTFPWKDSETAPPTVQAALTWLTLQENLLERGFTIEQVHELYAIQVSDWQNLASGPAVGSGAIEVAPPAQPGFAGSAVSGIIPLHEIITSAGTRRPPVGGQCGANPICLEAIFEQFGTADRGAVGAEFLTLTDTEDLQWRLRNLPQSVAPYGYSNQTLHFYRSQDPGPLDQ